MMVVPVLITNCQVSLNAKTKPLAPHTRRTNTAARKVSGLPVALATAWAKGVNQFVDFKAVLRSTCGSAGTRHLWAASRAQAGSSVNETSSGAHMNLKGRSVTPSPRDTKAGSGASTQPWAYRTPYSEDVNTGPTSGKHTCPP